MKIGHKNIPKVIKDEVSERNSNNNVIEAMIMIMQRND